MAKKERIPGPERFEQFYGALYGQRWPSLREALLSGTNPVNLSGRLAQPYYMDKASILAVSMLPISENNNVLDMCAAPGGKTLSIALRLNGTGSLVSNDRSASRRNRLLNVLDNCLTPELRRNIKVTGHDSTTWSLHEKNAYDRILLDAPCSSERHVLTDPAALSQWSPNRPKQLAIQQFAMLAAALDAAADGAYILYSTCSICNQENELIIEKLKKKRSGMFEEINILEDHPDMENLSEELPHGRIILPDTQNGAGPLYFCLLRKTVSGSNDE